MPLTHSELAGEFFCLGKAGIKGQSVRRWKPAIGSWMDQLQFYGQLEPTVLLIIIIIII